MGDGPQRSLAEAAAQGPADDRPTPSGLLRLVGLPAAYATRLLVMPDGQVVESGPTADVLDDPRHDYTRRLIASLLEMTFEG